MELADGSERPSPTEFETEALRFLPSVARYARLLTTAGPDADDLTQQTFLQAYRGWSSFRSGTDRARWLFAICRKLFLRGRRRPERRVSVADPEAELLALRELHARAMAAGLGAYFDRADLAPAIEQGLAGLAAEYREVAILVDVDGCSYEEAATTLAVPVATIRSRLFRARRLLQQSLLEHASISQDRRAAEHDP